MNMLGLTNRNGLYLGLVLVTAGCGSSSDDSSDARSDARTYDLSADRMTDAPAVADTSLADAAADMRLADAADMQVDGAATPDGRDTSPSLDGTTIDTARRDGADAPSMDGGVIATDARADTVLDSGTVDSGLAVDGGDTTTFIATLTGAQETPPNGSPAVGSAIFTLSADRTQLAYHVIHSVTGGTAAHIHLGAGGEPGAVLFPLSPFAADISGIVNLTPADAVNLTQGMLYVNVHSTAFPEGEVRGQILRPGETLWVATLTGAQEMPAVTTAANGHASLIVNRAQTSIRYHVTTTGLTPTGAQIQSAIATLAGPVIYQLTPVATVIDGVQAITASDNAEIVDRHWYINILTASNSNGELRGQVLQPGETLYTGSLSGSEETPPVTTSATGNAQFVFDPAGTSLRYEAIFSGLEATAAHIHIGAVGMAGPVVYPLTLLSPTSAKGHQPVTSSDVLDLDAGLLYINAHTVANPNGEIRGQILK